ncbi:HPr family phosphocarrier protein [Kaarinaea lacus]
MISKELTIINKLGLHARAAAKFVSLASSFNSDIRVAKDDKTVNGKSIMGVMMLAASQNTQITVSVEGEDEILALEKIQKLIANRFGEDE